MKRILQLLTLALPLTGFSQSNIDLDSLDMALFSSRNAYLETAFDFDEESQRLAYQFSTSMTSALKDYPETFAHPFDSLSTKIGIKMSPDSLVRIYSFDYMIGGTWHDIHSIVQLKTENGVDTLHLNTGREGELGGFTDAACTQIQLLPTQSTPMYLISAWGTHGSGHHHKIMRAFQLQNGQFTELDNLFDGEMHLAVQAPRSAQILLKFDPKTQTISYNEFVFGNQSGFYEPTGKIIQLEWREGRFLSKN